MGDEEVRKVRETSVSMQPHPTDADLSAVTP